jgi:hypothetical protein
MKKWLRRLAIGALVELVDERHILARWTDPASVRGYAGLHPGGNDLPWICSNSF